MKKSLRFLKNYSLMLVGSVILSTGVVSAQVKTLVNPGENTITKAVADASANDTLVLLQGESYTLTQAVSIDIPLVIMGEARQDADKPAIISFTSTIGEGGGLFICGANVTFKNLGWLGKTIEGKMVTPIKITNPNVTVVVDGIITQDTHQFFETVNITNIIIKNSKFFNFSYPLLDMWVGQMGGWDGDSVNLTLKNSTIFTFNRYFNFSTTQSGGTTIADHNTFVNTFNNTLFPSPDKEVVVKNSLFVNTFYVGFIGARNIPSGDTIYHFAGDGGRNELASRDYIPANDTLNGDLSVLYNPLDNTAARVVNISHNMKFTEKIVRDFHLAHGISTQPLINKTVKDVLAATKGWNIKDNYDGEAGFDPKFTTPIPAEAFAQGFQVRLDLISPENEPWSEITYRPNGALVGEFIWPLPFDFKATVETKQLTSDGFPIGDLNWVGADAVYNYEHDLPYNPIGIKNLTNANLGLYIAGRDIKFDVSSKPASISIVNVAGVEVAKLVPSANSAVIPSNIVSGVYIVKLVVGGSVQTKKAVVIQ